MGILSKLINAICKKSNVIEKITQKILALQKKVPGGAEHKNIESLFSKCNNTNVNKNKGFTNSIFTEKENLLNINDFMGRQVSSLTGKERNTFSAKALHEGPQNIRRYQLSGGYLESIIKPFNNTFRR